MLTILTAIMLAMSAGIVTADGSDPLDPSDGGADWDGDGLTNSEEQNAGTNMNNPDSDGDGLPDGWEVRNGLNPTNGGDANADPDGDGLTNAQEYARGTNPNNADTDGDGSAVHQRLVELRSIADFRNCYVAYTATPQACLSADTNDCVGYPKHFFWVLEPYMERVGGEGPYRTTSYLGATEVFNEYDAFLLRTIGRDEWPHHERNDSGKYLGVWIPGRDHQNGLEEIEKTFLEGILSSPSSIEIPRSLITALHSHIITNGVRWYDYWKKKR